MTDAGGTDCLDILAGVTEDQVWLRQIGNNLELSVIGGDGLSKSIAAASILAKVARDRLMEALDGTFPGYGFSSHKGYGAPVHIAALKTLGPCPEHRMTWAPIRELLAGENAAGESLGESNALEIG